MLLDLTSGFLLLDELIGHLLALFFNFLFELFVFTSQVSIFFIDFINGFLVFLVLFVKLSFYTSEMVLETLLDRFTLVPFLPGDFVMTCSELFVLVVVLTG